MTILLPQHEGRGDREMSASKCRYTRGDMRDLSVELSRFGDLCLGDNYHQNEGIGTIDAQ